MTLALCFRRIVGLSGTLASLVLCAPGLLAQPSALPDPAHHATPRPAPGRERTLLFVGDVMLSRGVGARMQSAGDWVHPFRQIIDTLSAADLAYGNLEGPVSDAGRDRRHLYAFRADPKAVEGLKQAGFDVMSVANNHIYDWGPEALVDTLRRLRDVGILPVGAGANDLQAHYPLVVDLQEAKLAFLAYVNVEPKAAIAGPDRPGVAWLEPERALADIRFARPLAHLVIVCLHWGVEYAKQPEREQVELAHQMIEAGADLVVGSHPHVVQPMEEYRGRWIAYSLGNFVFDQKAPVTHRGIMLKVKLRNIQITEVATLPIIINGTYQPVVTPAGKPTPETLHVGRRPESRLVGAR